MTSFAKITTFAVPTVLISAAIVLLTSEILQVELIFPTNSSPNLPNASMATIWRAFLSQTNIAVPTADATSKAMKMKSSAIAKNATNISA